MTHSIFFQHVTLAVISLAGVFVSGLFAFLANRRAARIEVVLNGRIDKLLEAIGDKA